MAGKDAVALVGQLDRLIHEIGGQKVMLDRDLAVIYGVETRVLNQAVRRNIERFPKDFMFSLTREEIMRISQIVTSSAIRFSKHVYAFTEHGAIMAATILNSPRAVQMSVFVVRAFVKMRQVLLSHRDLAAKLRTLEEKLTQRLDTHEAAIVEVLREVMYLLNPPDEPPTPREPLGFRVKERRAIYRATGKGRGRRPEIP